MTPDKPDRAIVDFTSAAGLAWWQERVREVQASESNHAFKPDFAEEYPDDARFADGRTGREAHNEYALRYQAATHGVLAEHGPVALFCRSGTAGAQRYPCHWVGDSPSTWPGLVQALRACLSLSLSGFGIVGHDIGGFWVADSIEPLREAFRRMDGSVLDADVDPELFARWAQWGAFSPVMRFHGTARREPTAYPEPARTVAIRACRWREALRPYLERIAAEAATEGTPMMRPMALAYPGDRAAAAAELQYLLGPDVLVAPILGANADGAGHRVWVPQGAWLPLCGLERVDGPGWVELDVPLEAFPAWVRADARETVTVDG